MTELVIVSITLMVTLIVSTAYHGRRRTNLLRYGCFALFTATLCHSLEPFIDGPWLSIGLRLSILAAQVSAVLLILTFRRKRLSPRVNTAIIATGVAIAIAEIISLPYLPRYSDGTIYPQSEFEAAVEVGGAAPMLVYHGLYLAAFAATTCVVLVGSCAAVTRSGLPWSVRASLAFTIAAACATVLFILSSFMDLLERPILGGAAHRKDILVIVVTFLFLALATGIVHKIIRRSASRLEVLVASDLVEPLWKATTSLHPEVRLPAGELRQMDAQTNLSRLTIETHDALKLIRESNDPALEPVRRAHPHDPHLTAGLVRHLIGETTVPPVSGPTRAMSRIGDLSKSGDESLAASVGALRDIRFAIDEQNS